MLCETEKKIKSCELRKILRDGFRLMFQRRRKEEAEKKSENFAQFFFVRLLKEEKFTATENIK